MAAWTNQFETQRQGFVAERRKAYDKAVSEVELLLKNHKESYAIDLASRAYLLADDKKAFRVEPWVDTLVAARSRWPTKPRRRAAWLVAMRVYSDLGAIEPANPHVEGKAEVVTRRVRLLAIYTPDSLKAPAGTRIEGPPRSRRAAPPRAKRPPIHQARHQDKDKDKDNDAFKHRAGRRRSKTSADILACSRRIPSPPLPCG